MKNFGFALFFFGFLLSLAIPVGLIDLTQTTIFGLSGSIIGVYLSIFIMGISIIPVYFTYLKPLATKLDKKLEQ